MSVKQLVFSATSGAEVQTVTLDGVEYRLRVRWSEPRRAWFADLYDADGQDIEVGRRLSPGYAPFLGQRGRRGPPGLFLVDGLDGYRQADLGSALQIYYVEART